MSKEISKGDRDMRQSHSSNRASASSQPVSHELYDLDEIKQFAARSVSDGAVTKNYPLDVKQACELLNEALAAEILCVLRYRHHQVIAKGINFLDIADEFREHAENEELHMMRLAERINQLGGDPDFNPRSVADKAVTDYGEGRELRALIKEDLVAERIVIDVYRKMIAWFAQGDSTTRRLLEEILADEEEHANEWADLLALSEKHN